MNVTTRIMRCADGSERMATLSRDECRELLTLLAAAQNVSGLASGAWPELAQALEPFNLGVREDSPRG